MRILFSIHHHLTPNLGAPGVTFQLAKHFAERGDHSKVLSFTDMPKGRLLRSEVFQQVRFPWYVARELSKVASDFDVIDCSSGDGWVYQTIRSRKNVLMVARSHGMEHLVDVAFRREVAHGNQTSSWKYPIYHGGYRLWEVAQSFKTADLSVHPNDADRRFAIEHLGVQPENAVVLPSGIPDQFTRLPARLPSSEQSGLKLAVVGSYTHRKINVAPQALNKILSAYPDLRVGFLGTGVSSEVVLKDYGPELHSRISVETNYSHANLPAVLAPYDVLLFPSLSEGFGLVVYEAMACGLAVVATELDALRTYLRHEHDVLFVPIGCASAIENAIVRLICDRALLTCLQRNGNETARRFTWSSIVEKTAAIYEDRMARKHHPSKNR
ncbi:MAG TPA: glycosyltransferase family 4 protein [Candidatus Acidoferrales bacterium]|jgi:glycosyltransferase involved in cell wall biosynthesis|nr:glycosyltransferase family 4 protein [Candidatus Acidoferrales bacterium]